MSDIQVQFKRGNTDALNNTNITDGMIYFNTENHVIYMDNLNTRNSYAMAQNITNTITEDGENIPSCNAYNNTFAPKTQIASTSIITTDDNKIPIASVVNNIIGDTSMSHSTIMSAIEYITTNKALFKTIHTFDINNFTPQTYTFDVDRQFDFIIIIWYHPNTDYSYSFYSDSIHLLGTTQYSDFISGRKFSTLAIGSLNPQLQITFENVYDSNGNIVLPSDGDYNSYNAVPYIILST